MNTILTADGLPSAPTPGAGDLIKDGSQDTFMADVIEASREVPVIVDFWAPWCGPCKQLTPAIESAVRAANGAVKLVKINVDENQDIAGQLQIQSIPTVFAFKDGQPVDGFAGAKPESELKAFIERITGGRSGGPELEAALDQADIFLAEGQADDALGIYQQVVQHDNKNIRAIAGFLKALIAKDNAEQARAIIDQMPPEVLSDPRIVSVKAELDLALQPAVEDSELAALKARVEADPKDHQARIDLSQALYQNKDKEGAVEQLLESIRIDRKWNEDAARLALLKLFEAMGPTDEVTQDGRRKLSAILFS
jgi:putative thioredoxin